MSACVTVSAQAAFAVDAGHALTGHTYVDSTHTYLTTSTDFVHGETLRTLAYTVPGSNKMQDLSSNLLAAFSGTSIVHNVAAARIPFRKFSSDIHSSGACAFSPGSPKPIRSTGASRIR